MVPTSIPLRFRREIPVASITTFVVLQVLDILTTMLGLEMGAHEASLFIGRLMRVGPLAALLIAKLFAVLLAAGALRLRRPRVVVFLNFWFAAVVSWNLLMIVIALITISR